MDFLKDIALPVKIRMATKYQDELGMDKKNP